MDWQVAIDRNRVALIVIIVTLMKSLGLVQGGALTTLPFHLYRKTLLILRPAEAAARRLIMMAAYDMELRGNFGDSLLNSSNAAKPNAQLWEELSKLSPKFPSFNLIDPLKTFGSEPPDYSRFGPSFDTDHSFFDKTPTSAASLGRRLLALKHALDSVEKQARRLARWYAARDLARIQNRPHRFSPLRPGLSPGYRRKPIHPVEEVLLDCHSLAQYARERRDSS